jgi:hypothetical protein
MFLVRYAWLQQEPLFLTMRLPILYAHSNGVSTGSGGMIGHRAAGMRLRGEAHAL